LADYCGIGNERIEMHQSWLMIYLLLNKTLQKVQQTYEETAYCMNR